MISTDHPNDPWSRVWRQFLPAGSAATPLRLRQTRRLVLFSLTIQFWLLVFLVFFVWAGARGCQITAAALNVAMCGNLVALRFGLSPRRAAHILCFEGWLCCTVFSLLTGGWGAPPTEWFIVEALFAVLLLDIAWGAVWTLAGAAALLGFFVADCWSIPFPQELTAAGSRLLHFVGLEAVLLTSYGFVYLLVRPHREAMRQVESLTDQLAQHRARSGRRQAIARFLAARLDQARRAPAAVAATARAGEDRPAPFAAAVKRDRRERPIRRRPSLFPEPCCAANRPASGPSA